MSRLAITGLLLQLLLLACTPMRQQGTATHAPGRPVPEIQQGPAAPWLAQWFREVHRPQPHVTHHAASGRAGWLALAVNHGAIQQLKAGIEDQRGIVLEDRGESHITIITPPEAQAISQELQLPIEALEAFAVPLLEQASWQVIGVGSFRKLARETFFVVVDSPDLMLVRHKLAQTFQIPSNLFNPDAQDLHITIGYVGGDLWPGPGKKSRRSLQQDLDWQSLLQ